MKSRYVVLSLSVVLALALAVPALGGPTNPIAGIAASVKQTANKALKKAKNAQTTANSALAAAGAAQSDATKAGAAAKSAQTTANSALSTANSAKTAAATAQTTANSKLKTTFSEFGPTEGPNTTSGFSIIGCPTGSQLTGGGYETSGTGFNQVVATFNSSYGNAWLAALARIPGQASTWNVRAVAICAKP